MGDKKTQEIYKRDKKKLVLKRCGIKILVKVK